MKLLHSGSALHAVLIFNNNNIYFIKKTLKFYKSFIKTAGTYIDEGYLF